MSNRINPMTQEEALESIKSELIKIIVDTEQIINAAGSKAVSVSGAYSTLMERDRPILEILVSSIPEKIPELEIRAKALWAASKRVDAIAPQQSNKKEFYKEGKKLKHLAFTILKLVDPDNEDINKVISEARPGTGYVDCAEDLAALHPQLEQHREALIRRELITEEQLDRIGVLSTLLLEVSVGTKTRLKEAKLLKLQAWVYFMDAYKEARRYIEFMHFHNPEALAEYPKLN